MLHIHLKCLSVLVPHEYLMPIQLDKMRYEYGLVFYRIIIIVFVRVGMIGISTDAQLDADFAHERMALAARLSILCPSDEHLHRGPVTNI